MKLDVMSKQEKQEFSRAREKVQDLMKSGDHTLKDALVKVSSDRGYGRQMAKQLTRMCNTGICWHAIREGQSLEDKTAQVDIAKTNEVVEELFGPIDKESSMDTEAQDYPAVVPDMVQQERADRTDYVAKAAAMIEDIPDGEPERAYCDHIKLLKEADRARDDIGDAIRDHAHRWDSHMRDAAEVYDSSGMDLDELSKRAVAAYGYEGEAYMETVAEAVGEDLPDFSKDATTYIVNKDEDPFATVGEGIELMKEAAELADTRDELEEEVHKSAEKVVEASDETRDSVVSWLKTNMGIDMSKSASNGSDLPDLVGMPTPGDVKKKLEKGARKVNFDPSDYPNMSPDEFEKMMLDTRIDVEKEKAKEKRQQARDMWSGAAGLGSSAVGGTMGSVGKGLGGGVEQAGSILKYLAQHEPPEDVDVSSKFPAEHINYLRNRKAESLFTSMISSDPVLSNRDPDEVKQKFNMVRNIRPDLVDHPMLLRTAVTQLVLYSDEGDVETVNKLIPSPDDNSQTANA